MPITHSEQLLALEQDSFHKIDRRVTGMAFEAHNEIGRLLDESIYQSALHQAVVSAGLNCERESEIRVTHKDFSKSYYIDLIVNGVIYETKASKSLASLHEAQLINYLILTNTNHGKLLNFRPESVESRFVSTKLTPQRRETFQLTRISDNFPELMISSIRELLEDWDTHLEVNLYRDALSHILNYTLEPVELSYKGTHIGSQNMTIIEEKSALIVTAITSKTGFLSYETHLNRLLKMTHLTSFQWVNFNKHEITIKTLVK
jgi:GxxExxY protein